MLAFGLCSQKWATCWSLKTLPHGYRGCHCDNMALQNGLEEEKEESLWTVLGEGLQSPAHGGCRALHMGSLLPALLMAVTGLNYLSPITPFPLWW